jgi:hypothetical protein
MKEQVMGRIWFEEVWVEKRILLCAAHGKAVSKGTAGQRQEGMG